MKDQASLNLLIVDSPIDGKALEGHLMLRATSDGLKLYNNTGVETPIGGEVDETRLLPTGAKDGDLLIKSAEIVGNDYNDGHTVLFIQGSASNAAAADSPLPVTWNNQPAVQEDNTLLLTGSTQLSTASAPEVKRVFGGEFTVEAYLKPTQFNNTSRQDTNFFYLNGPSTYYIYLSNYNNSGNAENGKFGLWVYAGNRQITLNNEEFHHVALDVYMEGTTRKYTIYYDGVAVQTDTWYNDGVADSTNAIIRFFSSSDGVELNNCYLKSIRVSDIARYKGKSFTPPVNGLYLPAPDGEWITINRSNFVEQTDHKLNPEPTTVDETKYGFSPALKKDADTETFAYEMPSKANDVPADSTLQLNDSGTPVFVEAEKVLLSDAKSTKLNQLDVTRQLPASPADNVTPVYKKQDVIGAMYNDSKTVVLLQGSKTNIAKNATFQLTGGDEVTVDSDGNLVFNRGNGIIVPAGKFNNEDNGQFTVDIMVAVDQLPSGSRLYEYILGNDNSPVYPFNYRVFNDGTVRFQYQNTSHYIQIEQGIFTLLSFDYDGTTLRSYKDGVLVGAQDTTYSAFPNTIGIGTDQYYQHTGFAGRIKYIRMSNIARYRGQAFTSPGLAGYITPPDGEWTTTPAIGDDRLLPNNPKNGDIPVYTNDFDKSNFNTTDTVCLLQNAGVNQFENVAKGKIGGSRISNYAGSVTIDENGYFVYPGGSGTWIEFIASGWNASGNGDWTLDVRMIAEATGSSQYFLGPANDGSGDPQAVIRGSGTTGTIQPYEISDMIHDITFGEEFTYSMAWEAATKTLRTWKDGKQMRKKTFTSNGYQFGFKGATEFWLGRNAVDPGLKGKVKYWRLSNAALYGDSEFTPPTDVYQDAPDGAWELVNKSELGGSGDVDESRLLPEDPANGDIPCYNATATTGGGNDVNTKVLLHFDELPFADTAAGNASPAAVTNSGVTLDTENFKFGTASAKFANSSNNLKVAVPQAQMMASPWLADCWFKVDDGQWSEYSRIFTQDDEQNGGWTYYLMSGNRVGVWVRNVTPDEPASAALTPGDWHYAALVYHDSKFYGFIDGVRFTVQDGSAEGFLNYIMLGKRIQSTSYSLRGNIDEFRFQLLDEAEIGKWTGTTIPVPTTPYSIQETAGEWGKFNKSELVKSVNGQTPDSSGAVTLPEATTSAAGLMAATDKAKLDKFGESDGKLTYDGAEIGGGGISEIAVGTGLSGTGITSDPLNLNIANYTSQSTISLSSTEGSVNLAGHNSVNLQETFGNKLTLAERGIVITTASGADVLLNEHASNSPSGFVILDSTGKLPAVDGSQLTNLPAGAVDLSAYTGGISLNSTNDSAVAIKFNSGNPTYNAELSMSPAGVTLSGYGDVSLEHTGGSYLRLTSGEATLSSNASLTLSAGSRLTISASEGIYLGAAGLNTAGGLVKVGDDGKIPSSLYDAGTGGDTSALETRVTTLETTVGTLNTTVDEILADYGEGSGALVYRVVASATEPENPTEGMLWIKTE